MPNESKYYYIIYVSVGPRGPGYDTGKPILLTESKEVAISFCKHHSECWWSEEEYEL